MKVHVQDRTGDCAAWWSHCVLVNPVGAALSTCWLSLCECAYTTHQTPELMA